MNNSTMPLYMQPPSPKEIYPKTKLAHGVLQRDARSKSILFALEPKSNTSNSMPLLLAKRCSAGSRHAYYAIYDAAAATRSPSTTTTPVAELHRVQSNLSGVIYELKMMTSQLETNQLLSIAYTVPSIVKVLKQDPARHVQVKLFDTTTATTTPMTLESLQPHVRPDGRFGLNFHGRGRVKSAKNVQLVVHNDPSTITTTTTTTTTTTSATDAAALEQHPTLVCQMAKWDAQIYHVDYLAPLSPLAAFGFALAQLDL